MAKDWHVDTVTLRCTYFLCYGSIHTPDSIRSQSYAGILVGHYVEQISHISHMQEC